VLLGCAVAPSGSNAATDYPNRTVRIIIPFSAGGAPDIVMRVVAQALSEKWKQSVVIENRPGANTFTGTTAVTRSAPDGYTLLFTADGTFILNPLLYASTPYAMNELAPLSLIATTPHVFAVSRKVQAQSVREFVALAKANPGKMTFGSTGSGSIQRLAFEFFSKLAGIDLVHVPYRGANETATALVAGEIDATINGAATVLPHVGQNGVRALAITTKQRSGLAPDLPTMEEAGVPGFSSQGAFGLLAPAGVPQDIREKLEADLAEVMQRPEMQGVLGTRYFERAPLGPVEFQKVIAEESAKWRSVIEDKQIKAD
jgi:tripartite-type tricarboxylate transporter receptor subunit TctC